MQCPHRRNRLLLLAVEIRYSMALRNREERRLAAKSALRDIASERSHMTVKIVLGIIFPDIMEWLRNLLDLPLPPDSDT